ncbi:MAG: VanZ family protein [Candidatus Marinimicrobia bacterium]|nr:VanZ family protein [Candidatus Neomarinimicrobiota bacterium]
MTKNKYRFFLFSYLIVILLVSSIAGRNFPDSKLFTFDKILHVIEYSILGFLVTRSYPGISVIRIVIILLSCFSFSALDEYWQSFIPGRNSSGLDILADNIGVWIGAGIGIASIFHKRDD